MRALGTLVALVALSAACSTTYEGKGSSGGATATPAGPGTGETGGDGTTPRSDGTTGSSCGECDAELTCRNDAPNGYCTKRCDDTFDCSPFARCYEIVGESQKYCMRSCFRTQECRPGYTCHGSLGDQVCYPAKGLGT